MFLSICLSFSSEVAKYVNTPLPASESYSIPKSNEPIPKYLEIIYDENDHRPVTVRPYEIPLPPLDEVEIVHTSSPTSSIKSICKSNEGEMNGNCIKGRTISSASTVSETSVYNSPKKPDQPNPKEDCTSNEKVLLLPQQPSYAQDTNKQKLQQMYANSNMETAIRTCDGITSM